MKRKFFSKVAFFAMASATLAFTNCSDDTDLTPVTDRLDALEQVSIPSIEAQLETFGLTVESIEDLLAGFNSETVKNYIDAEIADLQTQVGSNDTDIADLKTQIESNDTDIADLKTQIESNDTDIADLKTQIESNDGDISALQTKVTALENESTTLSGKITALETANATINAAIAALESADAGFETRIAALETAKAGFDASIAALETKDTELAALITALQGADVTLQNNINKTQTYAEGVSSALATLQSTYDAFVKNLSSSNITDWDEAFGTSFQTNLTSSKNTIVRWIGDELKVYWSGSYFSGMSTEEKAAYDTAMQAVITAALESDGQIKAAMDNLTAAYKEYVNGAIEDLNAVVKSITLVPSTFSEVQDNTVLFKSDAPDKIYYFDFLGGEKYYFASTVEAAKCSVTVTYRVAPAASADNIDEKNLFIKTNSISRAAELAEITEVTGDDATGTIKVTFKTSNEITSVNSFAFAIGVNSVDEETKVATEVTSDYVAAGIDYDGATNITSDIKVGKMVDGELVDVTASNPALGTLPYNETEAYEFLKGYDLYYDGKSFNEYKIELTKSFDVDPSFDQSTGLNDDGTKYDLTKKDSFSIVTPETALINNVITSGLASFAVNDQIIALTDSYKEQVTIAYAEVVINVTPEGVDPFTATWNYTTASVGTCPVSNTDSNLVPQKYQLEGIRLSDDVLSELSFDTFKSLRLQGVVVKKGNVEVDNLGNVNMSYGYNTDGSKYSIYLTITDDLLYADSGEYVVEAIFESNVDLQNYKFVADLVVDGAPEVTVDLVKDITYDGTAIVNRFDFAGTADTYGTTILTSEEITKYFGDQTTYEDAVKAKLTSFNNAPYYCAGSQTSYYFSLSVDNMDDFKQYTQDVTLDLAGCKLTYNADLTIVSPVSAAELVPNTNYVVGDGSASSPYTTETDHSISSSLYRVTADDLYSTFNYTGSYTDYQVAYTIADPTSTVATITGGNVLDWGDETNLSIQVLASLQVKDVSGNYFTVASQEFTLITEDPVAAAASITAIKLYDNDDANYSQAYTCEKITLNATTNSQNNSVSNIFQSTYSAAGGLDADLATALGTTGTVATVTYKLVFAPDVSATNAARLTVDSATGKVTYDKGTSLVKNIEATVVATYTYRYGTRTIEVPVTVTTDTMP